MAVIIKNIILNAKLKKVWSFVTNPNNFSRYVFGYAGGKVRSKNKLGVGAKYEWYGKIGPFKLKSLEEIITWKNNSYVAYHGKLFGITFDSSIAMKKEKFNRTVLIVSIRYKVPLLLGGRITDWLFVKNIVERCIIYSLYQIRSKFRNNQPKKIKL